MNQRRSAHVLTVAILTSALCADRIAAAMPALAPQEVSSIAEQLFDRLTTGLRRVVSAIRFYQARLHRGTHRSAPKSPARPQTPLIRHFSRFEFSLPPPHANLVA